MFLRNSTCTLLYFACSVGLVCDAQGRYDDALVYYNKSLKIKIEVYGKDHPDVAATQQNIDIVLKMKREIHKIEQACNQLKAMMS